MQNKLRLIIDTNLWISFLLTKDYAKLDRLFDTNTLTLLFSEELLAEFIEAAQRPKFTKYFSTRDLKTLLREINNQAEFINVVSSVTLCRDEKDNFLLALATDGNADYLIIGDKDLLILNKINDTEILSFTDFLQK
ncbi:putative toxin-antitoxin system toxin component, PIN family [Flavobacterium sp. RHBU_24]|uniref:putative toxin-antitoxin system toxin component, PIN family n=1 Tax=Flavobacterium sp. RHBU_24 TaxID=3391185 RepID=UPI003985511C